MPAISHAFRSSYVSFCWVCRESIGRGDMICFDQDDQIVHAYCA